jgi:hypothetical protein
LRNLRVRRIAPSFAFFTVQTPEPGSPTPPAAAFLSVVVWPVFYVERDLQFDLNLWRYSAGAPAQSLVLAPTSYTFRVLEMLGLPAVVMDSGGPKYVVEHGISGFVSGNEEMFIECVSHLMSSKNQHR